MSNLKLRRKPINGQGEKSLNVILTLEDGYELRVGSVSERFGAHQRIFWVWNCIEAFGQVDTYEDALIAFRAAWVNVTPDQIKASRVQHDFTTYKYAIWDIGGKFETADPQGRYRFRRCPCGATLDCWDQAAVLPHVGHIER